MVGQPVVAGSTSTGAPIASQDRIVDAGGGPPRSAVNRSTAFLFGLVVGLVLPTIRPEARARARERRAIAGYPGARRR